MTTTIELIAAERARLKYYTALAERTRLMHQAIFDKIAKYEAEAEKCRDRIAELEAAVLGGEQA